MQGYNSAQTTVLHPFPGNAVGGYMCIRERRLLSTESISAGYLPLRFSFFRASNARTHSVRPSTSRLRYLPFGGFTGALWSRKWRAHCSASRLISHALLDLSLARGFSLASRAASHWRSSVITSLAKWPTRASATAMQPENGFNAHTHGCSSIERWSSVCTNAVRLGSCRADRCDSSAPIQIAALVARLDCDAAMTRARASRARNSTEKQPPERVARALL
jgi:hypothetical protein